MIEIPYIFSQNNLECWHTCMYMCNNVHAVFGIAASRGCSWDS